MTMAQLRLADNTEYDAAMAIIDEAKAFLKQQGIDQWQTGYPDLACICGDIHSGKGYFVTDGEQVAGYLCLDFDGEPAYDGLRGEWLSGEKAAYAVVHRLAFAASARGKGLASEVFRLVERKCAEKGVSSIRCDTDDANGTMKNLLAKNGFTYCGTIWFDNSVKIAYEKIL